MRLAPALALTLTLGGLLGTALADAVPLKLDTTHSRLGFTAATLLFDVPGSFREYSVKLDGAPSDPEHAKLEVRIRTASIQTGIENFPEVLNKLFAGENFGKLVLKV